MDKQILGFEPVWFLPKSKSFVGYWKYTSSTSILSVDQNDRDEMHLVLSLALRL